MADPLRKTSARVVAVLTSSGCLAFMMIASGMSQSLRLPLSTELPEAYHVVSASVICGAVPQQDIEFLSLRNQGTKTIVSVDGMPPDVEMAKACGLRYVHIPIGYDGIPADAIGMLTRVVRECELPVYVHCHHGKHRGPAAAAISAMIAAEFDHEQALELLTVAGTSHDYAGLWRDVEHFQPLPDDVILPPITSSATVEPLAAMMVRIDDCWDTLQVAVNASRLDGVREQASILEQLFRESSRLADVKDEAQWLPDMQAAEKAAGALRDALGNETGHVEEALAIVSRNCKSCHQRHRN